MTSLKLALIFIINFIFDVYIYILILRLFMQKFHASWHNPFTQLIVKLTNPIVKPLRRIIPGFKGYDLSIVVLCLILEFIELWLLIWLQLGETPGVIGTLVIGIAQFATKVVNLFLIITVISAILSWFPQLRGNPMVEIVFVLSEPLLQFIRRFLRPISGFDFSPIVVILACILIKILILTPLTAYGMKLAFTFF